MSATLRVTAPGLDGLREKESRFRMELAPGRGERPQMRFSHLTYMPWLFKRAGFDLLLYPRVSATHSPVSTYSLLLTDVQIWGIISCVISIKPATWRRR